MGGATGHPSVVRLAESVRSMDRLRAGAAEVAVAERSLPERI